MIDESDKKAETVKDAVYSFTTHSFSFWFESNFCWDPHSSSQKLSLLSHSESLWLTDTFLWCTSAQLLCIHTDIAQPCCISSVPPHWLPEMETEKGDLMEIFFFWWANQMKWNSRVTYITFIITFRAFCVSGLCTVHLQWVQCEKALKGWAQWAILLNTEKDHLQVNRFSMEMISQKII